MTAIDSIENKAKLWNICIEKIYFKIFQMNYSRIYKNYLKIVLIYLKIKILHQII